MNNQDAGVLLLCLFCLIPTVLGFAAGWALQRRTARLGWPWGMLPEFIHRTYERIVND